MSFYNEENLIKSLSTEINNFMYDYNAYSYNEAFLNKEDGINEIVELLKTKPIDVINWIKNSIKKETNIELRDKMQGFIDRVVNISKEEIEDNYQQKRYEEEIDNCLSKGIDLNEEHNNIKICNTPDLYGQIGLDTNIDMYMTKNKIRLCNLPKEYGGHGIKKEQFYNLPKLLKSPAIIVKSQKHEKSVITFINDIDNDKLPIMVCIYPDGKGTYNFEQIDSNFITSVYGRNNYSNFIKTAIEENRLLFVDHNIVNELEKKCEIKILNNNQNTSKINREQLP